MFLTVRVGGRHQIAAGSADTGAAYSGGGRVVIVSSTSAHKVYAGTAAYSATKAGLAQMGRVLAREWERKGINVNMMIPGYFGTEMTDGLFDSSLGGYLFKSFPRKRLGTIASMDVPLLFLASDHSAEVTGTAITVDDGQSL